MAHDHGFLELLRLSKSDPDKQQSAIRKMTESIVADGITVEEIDDFRSAFDWLDVEISLRLM